MTSQIPILRVLAVLFFIMAGLSYYFGVAVAFSAVLVFFAVVAVVTVLALLGHRGKRGDIVFFVIGLLTLAAFVSPGIGRGFSAAQLISHTVTRASLSDQLIYVVASTDVGGINVFFSPKTALAYQVNFTRNAFPLGIFGGVAPSTSLTNQTQEGVFILNATAHSYDISIAVGTGYFVNVTASARTGSVAVRSSPVEELGSVFLRSDTGGITANLTSQSVREVSLQAGTGSINLFSSHLAPSGTRIPVKLHAGTGSVNLDVKIATGTKVLLEASTGLGGVNQSLQGFTISPYSTRSDLVAQAGDVSAAGESFIVQASAGTGSVNVGAEFTG